MNRYCFFEKINYIVIQIKKINNPLRISFDKCIKYIIVNKIIDMTPKKMLFFVSLILLLNGCKKEEQIMIIQNNGFNTYVFDNLIGNVRITIYNTPNSYDITVINGPGSVIGCAIRNSSSQSTIYFSDSYIGKGSTETQTSSANGMPVGQNLELKLVVYKSTVSAAIFISIEALGLDFWDGINEYKESIAEQYVAVFMLGA